MVSLDTPEFVHPEEHRIPLHDYPKQTMSIPESRMFIIKAALDEYKSKAGSDAPTYDASQGDGGASLPGVPRPIMERAFELQLKQGTSYDKPWGTPLFRKVTAENYWKLQPESGWNAQNIVFTQGGRDALNKAYNAMIYRGHGNVGDLLVVSRVPWISYNWGPYSVGLNVLRAPGQPSEGWRYTPDSIAECARFAKAHGRNIAGLVITSPDNPTGYTLPLSDQIELAHAALRNDYKYVIFDWMYHWVTDGGHNDINVVLQAFSKEDRERLIFLDGITKSLGGSNIRSCHLLAGKDIVEHITSQASHGVLPSFFAQAVAIAAYEGDFAAAAAPIIEPIRESRKVLKTALTQYGEPFVIGDGYYAFIDVEKYVQAGNFTDSTHSLLEYTGSNFGVVFVPGVYFSDAGKNWIRFSYALPPERTQKAIDRLFEGLHSLA
ncbi:MAG: pyridoxal phosphate-dependent aminotransferase [Phototrophicaceae bacterium]